MPLAIDPLIDIHIDDLLDAIGLARSRNAMLRTMLRPAARRFAGVVREFDDRVGAGGLATASHWLVRRMAGGLQLAGQPGVPASGPLLVVANHPGMTDTAALFASLHMRPDLRVIAQDRPFLRALSHASAKLIFVATDDPSRTRVVRAGIEHLRRGGALLTFPAGAIEPDPATMGARLAVDALTAWSGSFALFARAVPQTRIVTAIVSQVVSPRALRHPLTRLRRDSSDREKLAAALQILWAPYRSTPTRVAFGVPAAAPEPGDPAALRRMVMVQAAALIETPPADWMC